MLSRAMRTVVKSMEQIQPMAQILFGFLVVRLNFGLALKVVQFLWHMDGGISAIFSGKYSQPAGLSVAIQATGLFGCFLALVVVEFVGIYFVAKIMRP